MATPLKRRHRTVQHTAIVLSIAMLLASGSFADEDPWVEEMKRAVGLSVGDLNPTDVYERVREATGEPGAVVVPPSLDPVEDSPPDTLVPRPDRPEPAEIPDPDDTRLPPEVVPAVPPPAAPPVPPPADLAPDPGQPAVAALIREWIAVARPPGNAVAVADLRYNHRGRIVGTAPGVVIEHREADTRGFDPTYLWINFRASDSVDHCTMEEFVEARAAGRSIAHCAGRYREVIDVVGRPAADARSRLEAEGMQVDVRVVEAAPSAELAYTVADQLPAAQTAAARGSRVEIGVYGDYTAALTVPDVVDLPAAEARDRLETLGLVAEVVIGDEAPAADSAYRVYKQDPGAGVDLAAGGTVQVSIYAGYRPRAVVPWLGGVPVEEAQRELGAAGLTAVVVEGDAAQYAAQEGSVQETVPAAGTEVDRGTEVRVLYYGAFIDPRCAELLSAGRAAEAAGDLERARDLLVEARALECPDAGLGAAVADLDDRIARGERCSRLVSGVRRQEAAGDLEEALESYRQAVAEGCDTTGLGDLVTGVEAEIHEREAREREAREREAREREAREREAREREAREREAREREAREREEREREAREREAREREAREREERERQARERQLAEPFAVFAVVYMPFSQDEAGSSDRRAVVESRLGDLSQWQPAAPLLLDVAGDGLGAYARPRFTRGSRWSMPIHVDAQFDDGQGGTLEGALLLEILGVYDDPATAMAAQPGVQQSGDPLRFRSGDGRMRQEFDQDGNAATIVGGPLEPGWSPQAQRQAQQLVLDLLEAFDRCFVATAVYQSRQGETLDRLRDFRDQVMLRSPAGRRLAMLYYRNGPRLARWVNDRPVMRRLLRPAFDALGSVLGAAAREPILRAVFDASLRAMAPVLDLPVDPGMATAAGSFRPWPLSWLASSPTEEPLEESSR